MSPIKSYALDYIPVHAFVETDSFFLFPSGSAANSASTFAVSNESCNHKAQVTKSFLGGELMGRSYLG